MILKFQFKLSIVQVYCKLLYQLPKSKQVTNNTKISGEVRCPELVVEKGELSSSDKVEGTEVRVRCMKKHVLIGQEKVTCQSSGHWSTLPRCLKCGKLDISIEHSIFGEGSQSLTNQ